MSDFYCLDCAAKNELLTIASGFDPTGTMYQYEKFLKHAAPTASYPINSTFDDPSYANYSGLMHSALTRGCVELDNQGRINMIWDAGKRVGYTNSGFSGQLRADNAVKVPLPGDSQKAHAFPTAFDSSNHYCAICGKPIASS